MKITVIPGLPKLVCKCGAKMRAGESFDGRCWKCKAVVDGTD